MAAPGARALAAVDAAMVARQGQVPSRPAAYFCSWSGGKDSALALWRARRRHGGGADLLTMMIEDGSRSRSHGVRRQVLVEQSRLVGARMHFESASWEDYERRFGEAIARLRRAGKVFGVFGDIDIESHRCWAESVSAEHGLRALLPLWGADRERLIQEFLDLGFRARIVAVKAGVLSRSLLGADLDVASCREIARCGADLSGERGEYHTVVYSGPLFSRPLRLVSGAVVGRDGYWFQDFAVQPTEES